MLCFGFFKSLDYLNHGIIMFVYKTRIDIFLKHTSNFFYFDYKRISSKLHLRFRIQCNYCIMLSYIVNIFAFARIGHSIQNSNTSDCFLYFPIFQKGLLLSIFLQRYSISNSLFVRMINNRAQIEHYYCSTFLVLKIATTIRLMSVNNYLTCILINSSFCLL